MSSICGTLAFFVRAQPFSRVQALFLQYDALCCDSTEYPDDVEDDDVSFSTALWLSWPSQAEGWISLFGVKCFLQMLQVKIYVGIVNACLAFGGNRRKRKSSARRVRTQSGRDDGGGEVGC